MTRIVYGLYSSGGMQGGHKIILRHVEALRELGFHAVAYTGEKNLIPNWFDHQAPVIRGQVVDIQRDIFVVPDDATQAIRTLAAAGVRTAVIVQGHHNFVSASLEAMKTYRELPPFIAVSPTVRRAVKRLYPEAEVHLVRSFADERLFRPDETRDLAIAVVKRKRLEEAAGMRNLLRVLHPEHEDVAWRQLENLREPDLAKALRRAAVALSLNHLEGLGITTLEAMASGCLCVGFTGIGGLDYATPDNGFWVGEDEVEAAADALAEACAVAKADGPEARRRREAGYETARAWSYAAFREELEACWMALAPDARISSGPLEPGP